MLENINTIMILTEARREELKALIAAFRKDPVVKLALGRGEKPDAEALYRAIRRLIQPQEIRDYIKSAQTFVGIYGAFHIRKPFDPEQLDAYISFVKDFVAIAGRTSRGTISADTKKTLRAWVNNNTRNAYIDATAIEELAAIEDIRPDEPVLLYRGLMFSGSTMADLAKEDKRIWADKMVKEIPHKTAYAFLQAMRQGRIDLNMSYPTASSWTKSKTIAERFASHSASSSEFIAMQSWLHSKGKIDGDLGIVISTLARPEDIIVDLSKIELDGAHGNEREMILRAGTKKVRMAKVMTKDGPVDPLEYIQTMDDREN